MDEARAGTPLQSEQPEQLDSQLLTGNTAPQDTIDLLGEDPNIDQAIKAPPKSSDMYSPSRHETNKIAGKELSLVNTVLTGLQG